MELIIQSALQEKKKIKKSTRIDYKTKVYTKVTITSLYAIQSCLAN